MTSCRHGGEAPCDEESRDLVQQTRQTARRAQSTLRRTWDESPFLIGAAAAVVGALRRCVGARHRERKPADGRDPRQPGRGVQQVVKDKVQAVENAATNAVSQVQQAVGLESSEQSPDDPRG